MNHIPAPSPRPLLTPMMDSGGGGPAPAGTAATTARGKAARSAALAAAALALVWPTFWNGYPLVFSDTGTYLGQALLIYMGWDRPPFYSAFLHAAHWRLTLWGPVLAQGLVVAHLLAVVLRALGRPSPWLLVGVALALSMLTGLPWFAAQLMPDVFTGVVVLALRLLGFRAAALSAGERLYVLLLAAAAVAVHHLWTPPSGQGGTSGSP